MRYKLLSVLFFLWLVGCSFVAALTVALSIIASIVTLLSEAYDIHIHC